MIRINYQNKSLLYLLNKLYVCENNSKRLSLEKNDILSLET